MVELLDPHPGDHVLELAAGPGETVSRCCRGSSPEARSCRRTLRRRWWTWRGAGPPSSASPASASPWRMPLTSRSGTTAVDGLLCRFGLMLVPDMERMAAEIARVLRPGARAVLAVWASAQLNPWMTAAARAALELEAHRATRPQRARDRSGSRIRSSSGTSSSRAGSRSSASRRCPSHGSVPHWTSGGRRPATRPGCWRSCSTTSRPNRRELVRGRGASPAGVHRRGRLADRPGGRARRRRDGRLTSENGLAERARDELHRCQRSRVLAVEDRVRLDDLEGAGDAGSAMSSHARWASR